jgi:enamine deaminase RidA (YjgF/YER057c/UK114 family)
MEKRVNYSSGAPMEEKMGYSRMIKVGDYVRIGGTTSVQPDGTVFAEGDSYQQTKYVLEKQIKLLGEAGALVNDVISVKVYAVNMKDCGEICRAYSEFFKPYKPLCTVVGTTALNRPSQMVEIEMEAIAGSGN